MNLSGSGLSRDPDPVAAARAATLAALAPLGGAPVALATVFLAAQHADDAAAIAATVADIAAPAALIGALAPSGVIGDGSEIEGGPAVAVSAASLPAAELEAFALGIGPDGVEGWPDDAGPGDVVVVLADPYTFPVDAILDRPAAIVGGLSGGGAPGLARLVLGSAVRPSGAVAVRLRLPGVRVVVSQGCRPLGPELVVTEAEGASILALAGMPALEKLEEIAAQLPDEERRLLAGGVMAGLVVDENRPEHGIGDYLVRGIAGADRATGALVIGDRPRVGQGFRFHVRDAASAGEELRALLGRDAAPAAGALLFTCNGRGARMFGVPDHDAGVVLDVLGVPATGLFCQGELGPVSGRNQIHGFTATLLVLPEA